MLLDNSEPGTEGTQGHCPGQSLVHGVPESCLRYIKRVNTSFSPHSVSLLRLFSDFEVCCCPLCGNQKPAFLLSFGQCQSCHAGLTGSAQRVFQDLAMLKPGEPLWSIPRAGSVWVVERGSGMIRAKPCGAMGWSGSNPVVHIGVLLCDSCCFSIAGGVLCDQPTCRDLPGGPCGEGAAGQHRPLCRALHEKLGPWEGTGWGHGSINWVVLSAAAGSSVGWNTGCSVALQFLSGKYSLCPFYLHCSQAGFSWAVLGDLNPSPGKRQRIFRKSQTFGTKLLPITLQQAKAWAGRKKVGHFIPRMKCLHRIIESFILEKPCKIIESKH